MNEPSPNHPIVFALVVLANALWFWGAYLLRRRGIKRAWLLGDLTNMWKASSTESDLVSKIRFRAILGGIVISIVGAIALL